LSWKKNASSLWAYFIYFKHIPCSIMEQLITRCQWSQCAPIISDTEGVSASVIGDVLVVGVPVTSVSVFSVFQWSVTLNHSVHWASLSVTKVSVFSGSSLTPPIPNLRIKKEKEISIHKLSLTRVSVWCGSKKRTI
jgi:hypothetical protein